MKKYLPVFLLAFLSMVWGSSFILMKLGMYDKNGNPVFSANQVGGMRMVLAFLTLLPFAIYHFPKVPKNKFLPILGVGVFGSAIPAFLFTNAETVVSSSLAGMLNATTPIFTVIIGLLVFGNKMKSINYIGVFIGLLGTCGLMLANGAGAFSGSLSHASLILLATTFYAISVNLIRNYLRDVHPFAVSSISFSFIGLPIFIWLMTTDVKVVFETNPNSTHAFLAICILAVIGTAMAVVLFNYLVRMTNAVFASTVTYLIPITSISIGAFLHEPLNAWHLVFMGVILSGVYLINKK